MSSDSMLRQAKYAELATINELLAPAGITNDVDGYITDEMLDRTKAEKEAESEMSFAQAQNTVEAIAGASRLIHEASRVRRDLNITRASHKRLLLGCYKTLYQRKLKLEQDMEREDYV